MTDKPLLVQRADDSPLSRHPALLYLSSLSSEHSRRNMQRHLCVISDVILSDSPAPPEHDDTQAQQRYHMRFLRLDWSRLRYEHIVALRARLQERYQPATVNAMLSALRGTLRTAWRTGNMSAEDYHRAVETRNVRAETLPAGRDLAYREIQALLAVCDPEKIRGKRDAALIALLYITGMRRSEAAALVLADYRADNGQIIIRHGKGRKQRTAYVRNRAQSLLHRWLVVRGDHAGALFHPVRKGDHLNPKKGISAQAIYNILKRCADKADLESLSPHDLRRTFVGDALDAGVDLATVADIAGHASTDTTRRYDRRGERVKEQAADRLKL